MIMLSNIYFKLHNWLFPIDEFERDIVTVPPYNYSQSFDEDIVSYFNYFE